MNRDKQNIIFTKSTKSKTDRSTMHCDQ